MNYTCICRGREGQHELFPYIMNIHVVNSAQKLEGSTILPKDHNKTDVFVLLISVQYVEVWFYKS